VGVHAQYNSPLRFLQFFFSFLFSLVGGWFLLLQKPLLEQQKCFCLLRKPFSLFVGSFFLFQNPKSFFRKSFFEEELWFLLFRKSFSEQENRAFEAKSHVFFTKTNILCQTTSSGW